ncbi:hypothetical protein FMUND_109 [Fusarium mundagurra]|uniref:Uncharacterized protein n=1 Tax=Fusarium mundagurra TaxID=1567541 RepID=A0A8H5Z998_9HYPO|nr:hypothetical protein FMUND_109 [Fusarium mundagurra]
MLGMGDHNDAIEVYISHKRYMEALILTCLSAPSVWERQAAIIKKWGKWAVQHGQQLLAIRCFACTDQESTEPWTSPSASQLDFQAMTPSIPEVLSPHLSPPGVQRGPQRSIAKTSALKLITSFGDQTQKSKFFADVSGQTPIAAGVTPIVDSASSPAFSHASNSEATTAFLRPSNNSRFNTPVSARGRGCLPSIGEIPSDLNREALRSAELSAVPYDNKPRSTITRTPSSNDNMTMGTVLQRAATASPMMMREHAQRVVQLSDGYFPPSDPATMLKTQQASRNPHNDSRGRTLVGLNLQRLIEPAHENITSPEPSVASSTRYHWPTRRRRPASVTTSVTSASSAGQTWMLPSTTPRGSATANVANQELGILHAFALEVEKKLPALGNPLKNVATQIRWSSIARKVRRSTVKPKSRDPSHGSFLRSPEGRSRPPQLSHSVVGVKVERVLFDGSISVHDRASTGYAGDLKRMQDERRRKEQAAPELEERRKSLSKRVQIPFVPYPNNFSLALATTIKTDEPKPLPDDIPPHSATVPPQRSIYARNGPVIGLPATPKAMRLIIEGSMINQEGPQDPRLRHFGQLFSEIVSRNLASTVA